MGTKLEERKHFSLKVDRMDADKKRKLRMLGLITWLLAVMLTSLSLNLAEFDRLSDASMTLALLGLAFVLGGFD